MNQNTLTNTHTNMPSWEYHIISERHTTPELGIYRSYGVHVFEISGAHIRPVATLHDITTIEEKAQTFATLCNRYQLSPIHLEDFVQDFMQEYQLKIV